MKFFFVPVTEFRGKVLNLMKDWASRPWATNPVHVPGLDALIVDPAVLAQKCFVMFFEDFMLIRENGPGGKMGPLPSKKVTGAEECAALTVGARLSAFSLGLRYARGRCYGQLVKIDFKMIQDTAKELHLTKATDGTTPVTAGPQTWLQDGTYLETWSVLVS